MPVRTVNVMYRPLYRVETIPLHAGCTMPEKNITLPAAGADDKVDMWKAPTDPSKWKGEHVRRLTLPLSAATTLLHSWCCPCSPGGAW